MQRYYERMFGLIRAKGGHPEVNFRHVIGPQREMANKIVPVEMTRKEAQHQIKLGAKDVIQYFAQQSDKEPTDTHTFVQSSRDENHTNEFGVNMKTLPFHCKVNKRYANPERQAKYE